MTGNEFVKMIRELELLAQAIDLANMNQMPPDQKTDTIDEFCFMLQTTYGDNLVKKSFVDIWKNDLMDSFIKGEYYERAQMFKCLLQKYHLDE